MVDIETEACQLFFLLDECKKKHGMECLSVSHIKDLCQKVREDALEEAANLASCTFHNMHDGTDDLAKKIHIRIGNELRSLKQAGKEK